jgi:hypothetical protein
LRRNGGWIFIEMIERADQSFIVLVLGGRHVTGTYDIPVVLFIHSWCRGGEVSHCGGASKFWIAGSTAGRGIAHVVDDVDVAM